MGNQNRNINVNEDFCFNTKKDITISITNKAIKKYSENLEQASKLGKSIPVFIDTNVLLDYYKISFSERAELFKFFEQNKSHIFITKQIENEFLKHRIDHIRSYRKSLDEFVNAFKNIKSEIERLEKGEIKGFDHYLEENKILKNDYQGLRDELIEIRDNLKQDITKLIEDKEYKSKIIEKEKKIEEIKNKLEGQTEIERNDKILEVFADFKVVKSLTEQEKEFLKKQYDELNENYTEIKNDQNQNWKFTFPGCGENKRDAYGDFFIYHEILKYMYENKTDAVFLTNDVEKNDWLYRKKKDLLPYTHYLTRTFVNTEQILFIFQAKDKIRVSYTAIYSDDNLNNEITEQIDEKQDAGEEINNENLKIVGKIELPNNENYYFEEISEDEFLYELKESERWAKRYGDGFVGLKSFIIKYLGAKGYNYKTTYDVKDRLLEQGKIVVYIHKPKEEIYNEVEAIKLK